MGELFKRMDKTEELVAKAKEKIESEDLEATESFAKELLEDLNALLVTYEAEKNGSDLDSEFARY